MGDVELPGAPEDEGQPPEKKGLMGRVQQGVGAVKQAQAGRTEKKVQAAQTRADATKAQRQALLDQGHELFEYRVVPIRSKLVGDKMDVGEVDQTLNSWAAQGWHVKSIVETSVSGRVGPGGTEGLIIVFERRVTQA